MKWILIKMNSNLLLRYTTFIWITFSEYFHEITHLIIWIRPRFFKIYKVWYTHPGNLKIIFHFNNHVECPIISTRITLRSYKNECSPLQLLLLPLLKRNNFCLKKSALIHMQISVIFLKCIKISIYNVTKTK